MILLSTRNQSQAAESTLNFNFRLGSCSRQTLSGAPVGGASRPHAPDGDSPRVVVLILRLRDWAIKTETEYLQSISHSKAVTVDLPPFMSADRIATLCDWPAADRRRLVKQLGLVSAQGAEIDPQDDTAFWDALVASFLSNPTAYKTLVLHLKHLSKKAFSRRPDQKAFDRLVAKARLQRSVFADGETDFLPRVAEVAAGSEAFNELADWLWGAWLFGLSAQNISAVIDAYEPLQDIFGSWRPAIEAENDKMLTEGKDLVTTEPARTDDIAMLFRQVRFNLDEAERLDADAPLVAAIAAIEKIGDLLRARREETERMRSASLVTQTVLEQLRTRDEPADEQAAARLHKALDQFCDIASGISYADITHLAMKVAQMVRDADAARSAWHEAEAAHRASPFDSDARRTYSDALDRYQRAEEHLAGLLETATSETREVAATIQPSIVEETKLTVETTAINKPTALLPVEFALPVAAQNNDGPNDEPEGGLSFSVNRYEENILAAAEADANFEHSVAGVSEDGINQAGSSDQEENITDTINELADGDLINRSEDAERLAATLLRRHDIGLFGIACTAGAELNFPLPHPALARLLGLSGLQDAEAQLHFTESLQILLTATHEPIHRGDTWLRFAALSLPAITDPTLLCRTALEQLKLDDSMVVAAKDLQAAIVSLDRAYPALEALAQTNTPEADQEFRDAQSALRRHVDLVRGGTLAYQAATVVAHKLAQAFEEIARGHLDPDAVEGMIDAVMRVDETDEAIIRRLDREGRGAVAERKPIEARALARLKAIVKEFRALALRLTRAADLLHEQRRSSAQTIEATRRKGRDLHRRFKSAAETFNGLAETQTSIDDFSIACAAIAAVLLRSHAQAIETGMSSNPFRYAIDYDHFRLPGATRRPDLTPEAAWDALLDLERKPAMNWLEAFDVAMDRREHLATEAFLALAAPLADDRSLAAERGEAIAAARSYVENERAKLRDDLLTVMNYAPAGETSLDLLYQGVAQIDVKELPRSDLSLAAGADGREILDFPDALTEIESAKENVRRVRASALKALEDRLASIEGTVPADTVASLRKLVESDELITLAEELSLVERGQDIEISTPGPTAIEDFSRFLSSQTGTSPRLAEWERSQGFPEGSRTRALIRKWLSLRTARVDTLKRSVRDVLGELGFVPDKDDPVTLGGLSNGNRIHQVGVRVRAIADREYCSVARFGSEAEGQYRIMVPNEDTRPNEIVAAVSDGDAGATLVFAQTWLTPEDRRAIAAEARRLGRAFCLVDDGLLAFLCTRQRVLRDLFACGIPFAAATPYVTTPGSIPVEAFFGRNAEFDEISRRNGSCIVYGGRQLGKSVLLDYIEKRSRNAEKSVTVRLDCQGLTERRDILGLIDKKARPLSADSRLDILAAMEKWLEGDAERTILLMLDETNSLVRADALRDFRLLVEFRGVMERTNRRFKVVLSGQNNVLRLTQQPNTPLAHFGQPICIGPLKGADYKSARDLVTEPLAAVGYIFDSPQLVSRILVETQFYPKLVQMFCRDLLRHVRGLQAMHATLPPWRITGEHIEATLRNQKLRNEIFETFRITLDLDKRYELVALVMAVDRSDRRKRGDVATSMTEQKLREAAFYWWREGFSETNAREDFRGVLEELEGLGILTHDRIAGTYQLSSPIIANLIGSEAEIYDRLIAFAQEPAPREIEPSRRRARLASMGEPKHKGVWLNPLTPAQISKATRGMEPGYAQARPTVFFGPPDMLLEQVTIALEPKKYDEHEGMRIILVDQASNATSLLRQLNKTRSRCCFVVSPRLRWDTEWLRVAGRSGNNLVVFVGNLDHAWRTIVEDPKGLRQLGNVRIETLAPLAPIELNDHFQRRKIILSEDDRRTLLDETGGFLNSVGRWTDRRLGVKRDSSISQEFCPLFEPIPDDARALLAELIAFLQPDDSFDVAVLSDFCRGQDPARVYDWLMMTGLAEPVVREHENLRLNRVFWSPLLRKTLQPAV